MKFRLSTKSSRKPWNWSMLYSKRARQRRKSRCKWRSFHETRPSDRSLAVGLFAACSRPAVARRDQSVGANDVAVVGDERDLEGAVRRAARLALETTTRRTSRSSRRAGTEQYVALRKQAMQFLVQRAQFEQKAKELGLEITEADVDKQVRRSSRSTSARTASATLRARRSTRQRSRSRASPTSRCARTSARASSRTRSTRR